MAKAFNNKENFEKCRVPFKDEAVASKILDQFMAGVYKLRVDLGIANVTVIVQDSLETEPDNQLMTYAHYGDTAMVPLMAHWHVGNLERERKAELQRIASKAELGIANLPTTKEQHETKS